MFADGETDGKGARSKDTLAGEPAMAPSAQRTLRLTRTLRRGPNQDRLGGFRLRVGWAGVRMPDFARDGVG